MQCNPSKCACIHAYSAWLHTTYTTHNDNQWPKENENISRVADASFSFELIFPIFRFRNYIDLGTQNRKKKLLAVITMTKFVIGWGPILKTGCFKNVYKTNLSIKEIIYNTCYWLRKPTWAWQEIYLDSALRKK